MHTPSGNSQLAVCICLSETTFHSPSLPDAILLPLCLGGWPTGSASKSFLLLWLLMAFGKDQQSRDGCWRRGARACVVLACVAVDSCGVPPNTACWVLKIPPSSCPLQPPDVNCRRGGQNLRKRQLLSAKGGLGKGSVVSCQQSHPQKWGNELLGPDGRIQVTATTSAKKILLLRIH